MPTLTVRARTITALAGLAASATLATAQVPTEWTIQMQARTGAGVAEPFNLPAPATLASSQTIAIDEDGAVVFKVSSIDNNTDNNGIFYGKDGIGGLAVGPTTSIWYSSTLDINGGRIALADGDNPGGEIRDTAGALIRAVPGGGPLGVSDFSGLQINASGALGYRTSASAGRSWVMDEFVNDVREQTAFAVEGGEYSFLFLPHLNDNRQMAGKVQLSSGGDAIVRIDEDGTTVTMAETQAANPASPYERFYNNTALGNGGHVCFYGRRLVDNAYELIRSDGVTSTMIAAAGDPVPGVPFEEIEGFPSFDPAVNSRGWVAFRADQIFGQGVFVGDGETTVRLTGLDDILDTPQGQFIVQGFVSHPDINEAGQVSFIATLTDGSRAAFVATPVLPDCPADLNGDGEVDVFDLLAYLDDWFAGDADLNGDDVTDVFDLLAYLDGWFAGC